MHLTLVHFFYYILFRKVLGHSGHSGQFWLKYKFRPVLESEQRERENERNSLENETMGLLAFTLDVMLHT